MSSSTLIEVFGNIVFSFTRVVTEHYNPEEPEFTAESSDYNPSESTGREWYYQPVDELIYQEYTSREATSWDYVATSNLVLRVFNTCLPENKEELQEDKEDKYRAMAWKRHRPSAFRTTFKSMYIGALISLLTALVVGAVYMLVTYLSYKTVHNCQFMPTNSLSIQIQWMRTISEVISCAFLYNWYFSILLFLFRPFQLQGVKRKLTLVCTISYFLDSLYRVALQAFGKSHSNISFLQNILLYALFLINQCLQVYFITNHFCTQSRRQKLFIQHTKNKTKKGSC